MMNNWKYRVFSGWNFVRILKLALAIAVLINAWKNYDILFGLVGGVILFQTLMNIGCCGINGCDINQVKMRHKSLQKPGEQ